MSTLSNTYAECVSISCPKIQPDTIFNRLMTRKRGGIGMWFPDQPATIKVGQVGFVLDGHFTVIFDANGPLGERVLGRDVPKDFTPLPDQCTVIEEGTRPAERLYAVSDGEESTTLEKVTYQ